MRVVIRLHPIGMVTGCVALFHPTADVFLRPLRHLQQSDPHPGRGGSLPGEQGERATRSVDTETRRTLACRTPLLDGV